MHSYACVSPSPPIQCVARAEENKLCATDAHGHNHQKDDESSDKVWHSIITLHHRHHHGHCEGQYERTIVHIGRPSETKAKLIVLFNASE